MPGYSADECIICTEPGLCQPVRWKKHDSISSDIKEPVELRIIFQTNGDINGAVGYPSSPMLYCMYIADKGEAKEEITNNIQ